MSKDDRSTKILIVEDESLISYDYRLQLESAGFNVVDTVRNAMDAKTSIAHERPDMILMDIYIKGAMNGLELAKEIHKTDTIPILFLTASTRPDIVSEINMLTNCRMLPKPVNTSLLEEALEALKRVV